MQTFQTCFCIQSNSRDPNQTAPGGAVRSGSTLFAKITFKNHKQMTKQTTIVVIGSLRVNVVLHLLQIPRGHIWLEGDNKAVSVDSNSYGPVPYGLIRSRLLFRVSDLQSYW